MDKNEANLIDALRSFGSNASYKDFWNLYSEYDFEVVPKREHFLIAFGDEGGAAYYGITKSLIDAYIKVTYAAAFYNVNSAEIIDEIRNGSNDLHNKGAINESLEFFFSDCSLYNSLKSSNAALSKKIKNIIIEYGEEFAKEIFFSKYNEYLVKLLNHINVEQADDLLYKIEPTDCFWNVVDAIYNEEGSKETFTFLSDIVKEIVLPVINKEN